MNRQEVITAINDHRLDPEWAPTNSEMALALEFATRHSSELRYVAKWGKWVLYKDGKWAFDDTMKAFTFSRNVCREQAAIVNKPSIAKALASAKTVAAVERLAKADSKLVAVFDQWDADPWLLNTPGGVVDLKTGKLRPHRPDDYMMKSASVTPDANCPIPIWEKFLKTITNKKLKLERYICRMLGYGLTGITTEHALFFCYGGGSNGKGVLTNTAAGIFGDYHQTASLETFTASKNEKHLTFLAVLQGARLVSVTETEQGTRWAESKVKTLTGGDPIQANFMRQDPFEYIPQFKLLVSGNHRPGLNSVNEAIRRRVNMLPFLVTIKAGDRDKDLAEKLKDEWPGILAWMIAGCLEWQKFGLHPPKIVTDATEEYLATEDTLGTWITECLDRHPQSWINSSELFRSWKDWAEDNNEFVGSQKRLTGLLIDREFKKSLGGPQSKLNGFVGLRLQGTGQRKEEIPF